MQIISYKTSKVRAGESITKILDAYLPKLEEKSIVCVTSKIISLCENRVVSKDAVKSKYDLIKQNADFYLEEDCDFDFCLTIKNNILIPSAGIDGSNTDDVYVLYPNDVMNSAAHIWHYLKKRDQIADLGVLITDSHTTPLRRGVIGIGLGWCGFMPHYNYVGKPDCFGQPLRVTQKNNIDALSAAAVFVMGEGNEQTPLAVITNMPQIEFTQSVQSYNDISIAIDDDLYAPLLKSVSWKRYEG